MKAFSVEHFAKVCHEANRAYCSGLGDNSQPAWEDAPEWQRESAMDGVIASVDGSAKTPKEQHEIWMLAKEKDGWVYGTEKDAEKKTHPCMVAYEDLPREQRIKDLLFRAVVFAIAEGK